jgi:hypothetical protein
MKLKSDYNPFSFEQIQCAVLTDGVEYGLEMVHHAVTIDKERAIPLVKWMHQHLGSGRHATMSGYRELCEILMEYYL